MTVSLETQSPVRLPGPGKPSPMMWQLIPTQLKAVLVNEGCMLLKHWERRQHYAYVRFQYAPLVYLGDLFYLQRWSATEWHVSPSQLIFPHDGWPCTEKTRQHGSHLSFLVRRKIAELFPDPSLSFSDCSRSRLRAAG
ncbi:MAG: hypothetical protein AAF827_16800 [Cyanobacteria bacterium P01_D01_bin.6]